MFDKFQDEYFSKNPEKWKEVEDNMMKEHQEREKKMLEYKEDLKKKASLEDGGAAAGEGDQTTADADGQDNATQKKDL